MQLNQYNLYSLNMQSVNSSVDKVDKFIDDLVSIDEYYEIKDYLTEKFGSFSGEKWVNYPELKKDVYLYSDDEKIEFCALKNEKQYFGKGWKLIN